jgi:antitoxin ParD1/3/4
MKNENNLTLSTSLTEVMMEYVEDRMADGTYTSTSDCVRDLIRRDMERANKLATLRRLVHEGTQALDRGEGMPMTKDFVKDREARGRAEQAGEQD